MSDKRKYRMYRYQAEKIAREMLKTKSPIQWIKKNASHIAQKSGEFFAECVVRACEDLDYVTIGYQLVDSGLYDPFTDEHDTRGVDLRIVSEQEAWHVGTGSKTVFVSDHGLLHSLYESNLNVCFAALKESDSMCFCFAPSNDLVIDNIHINPFIFTLGMHKGWGHILISEMPRNKEELYPFFLVEDYEYGELMDQKFPLNKHIDDDGEIPVSLVYVKLATSLAHPDDLNAAVVVALEPLIVQAAEVPTAKVQRAARCGVNGCLDGEAGALVLRSAVHHFFDAHV